MGKSGLCVAKTRRAHYSAGFKRKVAECAWIYVASLPKVFIVRVWRFNWFKYGHRLFWHNCPKHCKENSNCLGQCPDPSKWRIWGKDWGMGKVRLENLFSARLLSKFEQNRNVMGKDKVWLAVVGSLQFIQKLESRTGQHTFANQLKIPDFFFLGA